MGDDQRSPFSTNGLDEYTASNFGGAMKGDLLAAVVTATPSTGSS